MNLDQELAISLLGDACRQFKDVIKSKDAYSLPVVVAYLTRAVKHVEKCFKMKGQS